MARRSRNRRTSQRDIVNPPIANRRLLTPVRRQTQLLLDSSRIYSRDNRLFDPLPKMMRPPRATRGRIALTNLQQRKLSKNKPLMAIRESFALPKETLVCVRRGVRKEVLHAYKKTGKGARSRRRRNELSDIHC